MQQQRVVSHWKQQSKRKTPNQILADLVSSKTITQDQARELMNRQRKNLVEMMCFSEEAGQHKEEAMRTRDTSFYGHAGNKFALAADHAMKAGFNSYAAIFLQEAINAKKLFRAPANEILALQKTLEGLKQ